MPTVELRFSALPAHVRTARLVAAAVARRSGVEEAVLDEVRLAVGEACSRAVELHRVHCPQELVQVSLSDDGKAFKVSVVDRAPFEHPGTDESLRDLAEADGLEDGDLPMSVGIAVITGLVENVQVDEGDPGATVSMTWPAQNA
jgi:serine/threonine-protein kinase RsbW